MTPSGQTVCLCMIVKNEAPVIRRCLDSVRAIVDSWVIVDTGSTDGTQAIVREHFRDLPGELVERPWRDFAHNRSEALALARPRGDYSLIIDADDAMVVPDAFRMPDLDADSYTVDIDFGAIRYSRPQLVRAALGWRYEGVIHEYLVCEAAKTSGHLPLVMRINQDGARRRDPETYKKDAAVLERAVAEETDPFRLSRYTFYLAQSYRDSGQREKALQLYLKRAQMGFWVQEVYCSLLNAGRLGEGLGRDPADVFELYRRATETCPERVEALHAASLLHRNRSEFAQGYEIAKSAPDGSALPSGLFIETWIYDYGLLDEFVVNAYWAGRYRDCIDGALRALQRGKVPAEHQPRFLANMRFALDKVPREAAPAMFPPARRVALPSLPGPSTGVPLEEGDAAFGAGLPRVIRLGPRGEVGVDCLEIDADAASEPDAVLDLGAVTLGPEGIRLSTRRFGKAVLRPGSADLIVAADLLQRVDNVDLLVVNCLHLLRHGGILKIDVPYDLAQEAWGNPAHRHAFNEHSWSRYSIPVPGPGGQDARFSVRAFEYKLSASGSKLYGDGMPLADVTRVPSAIDALSVTLLKVSSDMAPSDGAPAAQVGDKAWVTAASTRSAKSGSRMQA